MNAVKAIMMKSLSKLSRLGCFSQSRSQIPMKSWTFLKNILCDYIVLFLKLWCAQQPSLVHCTHIPPSHAFNQRTMLEIMAHGEAQKQNAKVAAICLISASPLFILYVHCILLPHKTSEGNSL